MRIKNITNNSDFERKIKTIFYRKKNGNIKAVKQ